MRVVPDEGDGTMKGRDPVLTIPRRPPLPFELQLRQEWPHIPYTVVGDSHAGGQVDIADLEAGQPRKDVENGWRRVVAPCWLWRQLTIFCQIYSQPCQSLRGFGDEDL